MRQLATASFFQVILQRPVPHCPVLPDAYSHLNNPNREMSTIYAWIHDKKTNVRRRSYGNPETYCEPKTLLLLANGQQLFKWTVISCQKNITEV